MALVKRLLHGSLTAAAMLLLQRMQLPPEPARFTSNVSFESPAPARSEASEQYEQIRSSEAGPPPTSRTRADPLRQRAKTPSPLTGDRPRQASEELPDQAMPHRILAAGLEFGAARRAIAGSHRASYTRCHFLSACGFVFHGAASGARWESQYITHATRTARQRRGIQRRDTNSVSRSTRAIVNG
jgi:hypothetical protein